MTPVDRAICEAYELVFAQNQKVDTFYHAIADIIAHDKRHIAKIVRDFNDRFPDEGGAVHYDLERDELMVWGRLDRVRGKLFQLQDRCQDLCQDLFRSITLRW